MGDLPRLELTEDINKKNDYIIFRHQYKGTKTSKRTTNKRMTNKRMTSKRRFHKKKHGTKKRKVKHNKNFFNIFS